MSKKFSIIKTIDFDKLSDEIEVYILKTETHPYVFMNYGTFDEMRKLYYVNNGSKDTTTSTGFIGRYHGCKVFVDNTLGFGEVEIR